MMKIRGYTGLLFIWRYDSSDNWFELASVEVFEGQIGDEPPKALAGVKVENLYH